LEARLCDFLGVEYISLFSNGTVALIVGLQALNITGEVITTPYSFVASTHALWWNNIKPVFADIEPATFNLSPQKAERAINPATTAILPVHVYGYPCDVDEFQRLSEKYHLKIVYDAAHAFGVNRLGKSILTSGDLSILSFHATKIYHTFEGGAIVCNTKEMKQRIDLLKNFGFVDEVTVSEPGINGKMNEIQAAMGLLQLDHLKDNIARRKEIAGLYQSGLKGIRGIVCPDELPGVEYNYSYFPILIDQDTYGKDRDAVYRELKEYNIYTRRYFYPLISNFPMYRHLESAGRLSLPIAESVSERILCLPIFADLQKEAVMFIIEYLKNG
jgi:dTDP-4-amino-4,6-dideoxygalactose transaminase